MPSYMTRVHGARWVFSAADDNEAVAVAVKVGGAAPSAQVNDPRYRPSGGRIGPHPPVYSLTDDGTGLLTPTAINPEARARGGEAPFRPGL